MSVPLNMTVGETVTLTLVATDSQSNVRPVSGIPGWNSSVGPVGTLTPANDGLSATFVADAVGTTVVTATAVGANAATIQSTATINVVAALASVLSIAVGTPH